MCLLVLHLSRQVRVQQNNIWWKGQCYELQRLFHSQKWSTSGPLFNSVKLRGIQRMVIFFFSLPIIHFFFYCSVETVLCEILLHDNGILASLSGNITVRIIVTLSRIMNHKVLSWTFSSSLPVYLIFLEMVEILIINLLKANIIRVQCILYSSRFWTHANEGGYFLWSFDFSFWYFEFNEISLIWWPVSEHFVLLWKDFFF